MIIIIQPQKKKLSAKIIKKLYTHFQKKMGEHRVMINCNKLITKFTTPIGILYILYTIVIKIGYLRPKDPIPQYIFN